MAKDVLSTFATALYLDLEPRQPAAFDSRPAKRKQGTRSSSLNSYRKDTIAQVQGLLYQNLKPEFLNRLDQTIYFKPLGSQQIRQIMH